MNTLAELLVGLFAVGFSLAFLYLVFEFFHLMYLMLSAPYKLRQMERERIEEEKYKLRVSIGEIESG